MIKNLVISSILTFLLVISFSNAQYATWAGYVHMSGSLAANGTYVTAHIDNSSSAAVTTRIAGGEYDPSVPAGYYSLAIACTGSQVNFKVCGINTNLYEDCIDGYHLNGSSPNFNLTVTKLSSGACTYSCACSGGYCCSGATEYTDGSGTGTCQSSACSAAAETTTTPGGGGGGGGGGGVTTTTTTSPVTTVPGVTTTTPAVTTKPRPVTTIPPSVTTKPKKPWVSLGIELSTLQIVGIIVGVVVILALVIFLFVRFQSVKMAT